MEPPEARPPLDGRRADAQERGRLRAREVVIAKCVDRGPVEEVRVGVHRHRRQQPAFHQALQRPLRDAEMLRRLDTVKPVIAGFDAGGVGGQIHPREAQIAEPHRGGCPVAGVVGRELVLGHTH
jgi:hypothetical protein